MYVKPKTAHHIEDTPKQEKAAIWLKVDENIEKKGRGVVSLYKFYLIFWVYPDFLASRQKNGSG